MIIRQILHNSLYTVCDHLFDRIRNFLGYYNWTLRISSHPDIAQEMSYIMEDFLDDVFQESYVYHEEDLVYNRWMMRSYINGIYFKNDCIYEAHAGLTSRGAW